MKKMTATISGFIGFNSDDQEFYASTLEEALNRIQKCKFGYICQIESNVITRCWNKEGKPGTVSNGTVTLPD